MSPTISPPPTAAAAEDDDSPLLYRSPDLSLASSRRQSRLSFAPSGTHGDRRPISLADPPAHSEEEDGEGYWAGAVQQGRRKSVGLGLRFGIEGWVDEEQEEEEEEGQEGGASPPLSPSSFLSTSASPASPTSSTSTHARTSPQTLLSRYSSASAASTAATSVQSCDGLGSGGGGGLGPPIQLHLPAAVVSVEGAEARMALLCPPQALLTPDTLHEAFAFPLPPGAVLPPSPSTSPALAGGERYSSESPLPIVVEPEREETFEESAAASFAFPSSSVSSFAPLDLCGSPFSHDPSAGTGDAQGSHTRLPSYESAVPASPAAPSHTHAQEHPRPLDPWAFPAGGQAATDEERGVLDAVMPLPSLTTQAGLGRSSPSSPSAASPRLVPFLSPPLPPQPTTPTRSPSLPLLSPPPPLPSPGLGARKSPSSPSGFASFLSKSPSFASSKGASLSPPALPAQGGGTKRGKRSSMLLSLASAAGLRSPSSSSSGKRPNPAPAPAATVERDRQAYPRLSVIGEGGSSPSLAPSLSSSASALRRATPASSASASAASLTDQLALSAAHELGLRTPGSGSGREVLRLANDAQEAYGLASPGLFPRSPSLFLDTPHLPQQQQVVPPSKAARMLGVDAGRSVLVPSPTPSPAPSPTPSPRPRSRAEWQDEHWQDDTEEREGEAPSPMPDLPYAEEFGAVPAALLSPAAIDYPAEPPYAAPLLPPKPPVSITPPLSATTSTSSSSSGRSKAAQLLGLSEAQVSAAAGAGAKGRRAGAGERGRMERVREGGAAREVGRGWEVLSADLYKLTHPAPTLLRPHPKPLHRPRLVVLSSLPSPDPSFPPTFLLASYRTRALSELPTAQLELSPSSVVCAPLEGEAPARAGGGRAFALKVSGLKAGKTEETWILGLDQLEMYTEWMGRLKAALRELRGETGTAASDLSSSLSRSQSLARPSPTSATFDLDAARLNAAASIRSRSSSAFGGGGGSDDAVGHISLTSGGWRAGSSLPSGLAGGRGSTASFSSVESGRLPRMSRMSSLAGPWDDDTYSLSAASTGSVGDERSVRGAARLEAPGASFLDADESDEDAAIPPRAQAAPASTSRRPPPLHLAPLPPHGASLLPSVISPSLSLFSLRRESSASALGPPTGPPPSSPLPPVPFASSSAAQSRRSLSIRSASSSSSHLPARPLSVSHRSSRASLILGLGEGENVPPPSLPPPKSALPVPPPVPPKAPGRKSSNIGRTTLAPVAASPRIDAAGMAVM
ncbi:hypothetical protein JCM10207_003609 [Rhodosporidiobolus poonsookiae]